MKDNQAQVTDWHTARERCVQWGGHLAVIESEEESVFLDENTDGEHWIGYNDLVLEGLFSWDGGAGGDYENWTSNQPDGGETDDCVRIHGDGTWDDMACTALRSYICEKPAAQEEPYEADLLAYGVKLADGGRSLLSRLTLGTEESRWGWTGLLGEYDPTCEEACANGACPEAIDGQCDAFDYADECAQTELSCGVNAIPFDQNCDGVLDICQDCPAGTYAADSNQDGCLDMCYTCGSQQVQATDVRVQSSRRSVGMWVSGGPVASNVVRVNAGAPSTGLVLHHNVYPAHNNTVVMNQLSTGIQTSDSAAGLVNNLVRVQVGSTCLVDNGHEGTRSLLLNNLFYGCLAKFYTSLGTLIPSIVGLNALETFTEVLANISSPPKFVGEELGLYTLDAGSPAVDAGYDTMGDGYPGILVHDVDRLPRPVGAVDIGAHEQQETSP